MSENDIFNKPQDPGLRFNDGKPRYDLVPSDALAGVVDVLTAGAKKYEPRNWERGMAWSKCFASMMRHAWAFWRGEDKDAESGLPHIDHVVCNAMFLAAYVRRADLEQYDDRPAEKKAAPGPKDPLKDPEEARRVIREWDKDHERRFMTNKAWRPGAQ